MGKVQFFLAALFLVALPQSKAQRSIPPEIQQKIEDYIQNVYLPLAKIDGLGVTIVQNFGDNGNILYTNGYGWANKEKNIQMGNDTQLLIGSCTKNMVGLLVAKLLHETHPELGEAALDTPIHQLLPQADFILNDRFRTEHVTFRGLLAHRVCLWREDVQLLADVFNSTADAVYAQRYNAEICGVRSEFQYNNHMYAAAGELAGLLAGKSFEDAFQDLLNELGMTNTAFVQRTDDFQQMPNRAMPYYIVDGEMNLMNEDLVKRVKTVNAAGGLFVPPNDMARYLQLQLSLGRLDGVQIIPENVMGWTTKPSNVYPLFGYKMNEDDMVVNQFGYGLGWALSSYDGWEFTQHGGSWPTYLSQLSLFPAKRLGIFTSTNNGPVHASEALVHFFIFEVLNGNANAEEAAMKAWQQLKKVEEAKKLEKQEEFRKFHHKMIAMALTAKQEEIAGHYGSGSLGEVDIYEKLNEETNQMELYFEYGKWYKGWVAHEFGGLLYTVKFDTDVVQDDLGFQATRYLALLNDELYFYTEVGADDVFIYGIFKKGLRSGDLPTIPYEPDSCGPE